MGGLISGGGGTTASAALTEAEAATEVARDERELLESIDLNLRLMNRYLAEIVGETFNEADIDPL
jgi:hypothetical protein